MKRTKCYFITGGGYGNKGAESMLFTLIEELRRKDPDCKITAQVTFDDTIDEKKKIYDFDLIDDNFSHLEKLRNNQGFFKKLEYKFSKKYPFLNALLSSDAVFDVSGFSISSDKSFKTNYRVFYKIELAKAYNKKIILMPQSIGPVDYNGKYGITNEYLKKVLSYPEIIFCRENDGYNLLKNLGLKNIIKSNDMVLENPNALTGNGIFKITPSNKKTISIPSKSVLIIPNKRLFERCKNRDYYKVYENIISYLLKKNYNIVISHYDNYDIELCRELKNLFKDNNKVILEENDLNCIEYSEILDKFEFLILSRFHSIVHSYRKYAPVLILGWAVKYNELAQNLNQEKFLFDCRNDLNINDIYKSIDYLIDRNKEVKETIKNHVLEIQKHNRYDIIRNKLNNEHK